jgi:protein-disulfide isomerase
MWTILCSSLRNVGRRLTLDTVATVAVLLASVAVLGQLALASRSSANAPPAKPPNSPLPLPDVAIDLSELPVDGSFDAGVALIGYSDFECPFCAAFVRDVLPDLREKYIRTGKVLMAFQAFPLARIHPRAEAAAVAAYCAAEQGLFWPMHDALFGGPSLDDAALSMHGRRVGLQEFRFVECRAEAHQARRFDAAITAARQLGVSSTPSFFVGTLTGDAQVHVTARIVGAQPLGTFVEAIESALAAKK